MTTDLGTAMAEMLAEEFSVNGRGNDRDGQLFAVASQATPEVTSISTGVSIVGKIAAQGAVTIFGQVEGEIVADELTISGHVKGTVHANRVKLNSTAVVEGDIFYRTLAIEENARFEGMVRRNENTINTPSDVQKNRSHAKTVSIEENPKGNDSSDGRAADLGPNFKASLRRLLTR